MVRDMVDDHLMRSVQLWAQLAELPEYRQANSVMAFVAFDGDGRPLRRAYAANIFAPERRYLVTGTSLP